MNGYFNYRDELCPRDELYHYGVLGMKWGVRRYQSYSENPKGGRAARKQAYKDSKKEYKRAKRAAFRENYRHGIASRENTRKVDNAIKNREEAYYNMVRAKANIKGTEKAERKAYIREMKRHGISGSAKDIKSGGKSTKFYDYIEKTKGSEYAKNLESSARKAILKDAATLLAVGIGMQAASAFFSNGGADKIRSGLNRFRKQGASPYVDLTPRLPKSNLSIEKR